MGLNFRGIRFCKDYIEKYLKYIFYATSHGQLDITDGTKKFQFSNNPYVVKMFSWDARNTPCVLIGSATGSARFMSVDKDHLTTALYTDADQVRTVGGDIVLSIELSVRATTIDERDSLVDIVCIYMQHPDAKTYFQQQAIVFPEPPRIGGESRIDQPGTEYPIFATSISVPIIGYWRDSTAIDEPRLQDVITDVSAILTL